MRSHTRAEEVRRKLADDIVQGRLPPGLPLEEIEIARAFGVSRTPVREAIRQLEAMGFAEARPRRGAVVAAITRERLNEMFSVMKELEALCARYAAEAMTDEERARLAEVHAAAGERASAGDVEGYYFLNDRFHDLIYSGSHNSYLAELTQGVRSRVAPFRRAQFQGPGRLTASHHEHDAVVAAILACNGDAAQRAMSGHIETVRDAFVAIVPSFATGATAARLTV